MTLSRKAAIARRTQAFPPTVIAQLRDLEADLGGRAAVVGMLTLAPLTQDLRYLLGLLGDPKFQTQSLAEICARANVLPGDLAQHLATAALLAGKVRAAQQIGQGIAAVTADVMRRAAPYQERCTACGGLGALTANPTPAAPNPSPQPCTTCQGTGQLIYAPDFERQKLAVDLAQLLPKGGGIQIAQINATSGGAGGGQGAGDGALERLQQLTDRILYGDPLEPAALDADILDLPEAEEEVADAGDAL